MKNLFLLLLSISYTSVIGQQYTSDLYISQKDTLPYRILLPKDFDAKKSYSLLLVLHGAGERGNDNQAQLVHGSYLFVSEKFRDQHPAIVVFPQCPTDSYWAKIKVEDKEEGGYEFTFSSVLPENRQLEIVEELLDFLHKKYRIDANRRYVGGLSMGGMGTFELVSRNPNYFAAAVPICGGGNPAWASLLNKTPLWIFHGEKDQVVPVEYSKAMHRALKEINATVKLTLYPEVNHDSWNNAFADPNLMHWLFSHTKK